MKKLFILLLLVLFAVYESLAYSFSVNGIYYNIISSSEKTCAVTYKSLSSNSYIGDIEVPETVTFGTSTYTVTAISQYAFAYSNNLTSVKIPETVSLLGSNSFNECM